MLIKHSLCLLAGGSLANPALLESPEWIAATFVFFKQNAILNGQQIRAILGKHIQSAILGLFRGGD